MLTVTVVLGITCGCGPDKHVSRTHPRIDTETLRRGIGGEPSTLDPAIANDNFSFEVLHDLYEGLVTESAAGAVQPGTASSWEVDPSGMLYTFHLRNDAKWSNGKKVRAEDFVSAWQRLVDPSRASPVAELLRPIANARQIIAGKLSPSTLGVSAEQDGALIVRLEEPAPYFLELLTHSAAFPIFSEGAASAHSAEKWISNGPYVLSDWIPGGDLKLSKNYQYWDQKNTRITYVDYRPVPDENTELNQYRAGQLDLTESVPASALPLVRREYPGELLIAPYLGTIYYAINLKSTNSLSDVRLRKALAMAIDRKALENTLLIFGQSPAYGFVPPGTWNYDPQSWDWKAVSDDRRISEARNLYKSVGYSSNNPLHLRILFNSSPSIKRMTVAIASMWREILGVQTELIDEEYRVFLESRKDPARWDIARLAWVADYNDAGNFLEIFRRGSLNNDEGLHDANVDSLLDTAAATPDPSLRRSELEKAERAVLDEYPVIPVYFFSTKRLIKPYVKGAQANPLNRLYSKYLFIQLN